MEIMKILSLYLYISNIDIDKCQYMGLCSGYIYLYIF